MILIVLLKYVEMRVGTLFKSVYRFWNFDIGYSKSVAVEFHADLNPAHRHNYYVLLNIVLHERYILKNCEQNIFRFFFLYKQ